jgi:hypothetical protein
MELKAISSILLQRSMPERTNYSLPACLSLWYSQKYQDILPMEKNKNAIIPWQCTKSC